MPAYVQSVDVGKIQTFIQSVIQVLVTLSGLVAVGFIVWGGVGYITSSGNPEALEKSKKTILYSAIGLTLVLGAFVMSEFADKHNKPAHLFWTWLGRVDWSAKKAGFVRSTKR